MEARHPITGQPIRILRSESNITSDRTTLLWLRASFSYSSHRWQRWHCVVSEPVAVDLVDPEKLTAVLLNTGSDLAAWAPLWPKILTNTSECLVLAPESVFTALEKTGWQWRHTLTLEELHENYPFLGEPITAADETEKVILSLAHILRMSVVVWSDASHKDREAMPMGTRMVYDAWQTSLDGKLSVVPNDTDDSCIPHTWLIQQYFRHPTLRRARELRTCLEKNIESPWIDHILLLNEGEVPDIPTSEKIQIQVVGHRLTYYDVFVAIKDKVPAGDYAIFANSDIWFNETLSYLWKISLTEARLFLALLRWEDNGDKPPQIFGPRSDSQDAWIIARNTLNFDLVKDDLDFQFGKSGCDNAVTIAMLKKKCLVVNPAYSIRTMHLHTSNVRNYDPKDVVNKPAFLYVDPTPIQPLKVCKDLSVKGKLPAEVSALWKKQPLRNSFERPILALQDMGPKVICRMLKQTADNEGNENDPLATYQPNEDNIYTPTASSPPLYHFQGSIFVNYQGLIHSFHDIFVGSHTMWMKQWESAQISQMMPSIYIPSLIAVPVNKRSQTTLSQWILTYLPKVLTIRRILKAAGQAVPEFLVPQLRDIASFLNDCFWPESEKGQITLVPLMEDMKYYAKEVWAMPPTEETDIVSSEDIALLRALIRPTDEELPKQPVAVFCLDSDPKSVCTSDWADSVSEFILAKGWILRYVSDTDTSAARRRAFSGASWIFGSSASSGLDYMWLAPAGAYVMEFNSSFTPRGDRIHLAGACGLHYVAALVQKEPLEIQKQNALMELGRAIQKFGFDHTLTIQRKKSKIPRVLVPAGKALGGIWNHSGDTFREMVDIWAERGYVEKETTEDSGFCWWGGVGEILLYDRPTTRWWSEPPSYQMALFGNCPPPDHDMQKLRQSVWSFWPRSPKAVEAIHVAKKNLAGYTKRTIMSIFLGKIENGVQHEHRTKYDWSKVIEMFSMPIDSTGAAYPYTQSQYLKKLCVSRFGLCLPGFGPKCNREIEYFACGVVPLVTDGVDMKGYLVPPKEGVHYLRVKTPEDVLRAVHEITPAKWTEMSAAGRDWWLTYASATGLFRLTMTRIEQCRPYFNVGIPPTLDAV
jgi:hypothetical protein